VAEGGKHTMVRSRRRLVVLPFAVMIAVAAALAVPVMGSAASGGDSNRGDVWLDNVGQPAGPGHEMDPHLACADINLWGANLADASGVFTIDGWPPSGRQEQVYPASGSAAWHYSGGKQARVIAVIPVRTLIANAAAKGDSPAHQGYHFKLQLSQDPQKHKTFWVNCTAPSTAGGGTGGGGGGSTGGGNTGSTSGSTVSGSASGASGATTLSTTPSGLAQTGGAMLAQLAAILGLLLVLLGLGTASRSVILRR
jgi:hypothetical protein